MKLRRGRLVRLTITTVVAIIAPLVAPAPQPSGAAAANRSPKVKIVGPREGTGVGVGGRGVDVLASISDADTTDTHTCAVNWGDGSTTPGTVSTTNGSKTCAGHHVYGRAQRFEIAVKATDVAGASSTDKVKVLAQDSKLSGGAFGVSVVVKALLSLSLGPTPTVTLPGDGGGPFTDSAASVGLPLLGAFEGLKVTTQGSKASPGAYARSSAVVAKASIALGSLALENLTASCASTADGSTGAATVGKLSALGVVTVDLVPAPNTSINVGPLATLVLNEQVKTDRAATTTAPASTAIIVNGAHLRLLAGNRLGTGDIILAQARCGLVGSTVLNHPPVASDGDVTADEDAPRAITLVATDPDPDTLTYTVVTPPSHGTLAGVGASRTYTPAPDYNGPDTFAFKANDGTVDSNVATVRITAREVNDAPVANPDAKATDQDRTLSFPAADLVVNDSPGPSNESTQTLTVTGVAKVATTQGSIALASGAVTYTPKPGFSGADPFSYTVCDNGTTAGAADPKCSTGTVTVEVRKVNHAPVASDRDVVADEDTAKALTLVATDPDGNPLTFTVVTSPSHGALTGTGASRTYTPAPDYNGLDSFTFKANDGSLDSNVATVRVTVREVNDPPVANPDAKSTDQDRALSLPAADLVLNDSPGPANESTQTLSVSAVAKVAVTQGDVTLASGTITFTPKPGYFGTDSFAYTVCDNGTTAGAADPKCATGTVTVNVARVNHAPVASDLDVVTDEDTPKATTLVATDPDGNPLMFTIVTPPAHGALTGSDASRTYTPAPDYNGLDSFTFKASDGSLDSNVATVRITVREVNDPPVANPDAKSTDQDRALTFPAADLVLNDSPGPANESTQTLSVSAVGKVAATQGEVTQASGAVTFTPKAGYSGTDSFAYTVCDNGTTAGAADPKCANGTVNVEVRRVNRAPIAADVTVTAVEDTPKDVALSATDPDGDSLTFTIVVAPANGTLSGAGANRTYTPVANFNGTDTFTYKANDGATDSNPATVRITVAAVNDPPTANPDTKSTIQGQALSFPATDLSANDLPGPPDEAAQALTVTKVAETPTTNGAVTLVSGTVTYTPRADFLGDATFTYEVCDPEPLCAGAVVTVGVHRPANRPPAITSVPTVSEWLNLTPAGSRPTPRYLFGAQAYDEVNDRIIVFSGAENVRSQYPADVWVLTNASGTAGPPTWVEIHPVNAGPVGRMAYTSAYDPTANRLIVYGGCSQACSHLSDAWVLTHANGFGGPPEWIRLPEGGLLASAAGAYDPISNRLIVFGGITGAVTEPSTVQVLVDANGIGAPRWETVATSGSLPPGRGEPSVATYDALTNRLTVFGGLSHAALAVGNDAWVLTFANGLGGTATWSRLEPAGVPPSPRGAVSSVFDPNSGRMITFGGWDSMASPYHATNETWVLSGANGAAGTPEWRQVLTAGSAPPARAVASIGYQRASNRMIITLGRDDQAAAPGAYNDTWVLTNASGQCTAGQPCNYDVEASDPDGDTLSYALASGPSGMTINASTGLISWTPSPSQIGDHPVTVRVLDPTGLSATQSFTLTVAPVVVPNVVGLDPASARALIGAADLRVGTETILGGGIDLKFNSLPSEQGAHYGNDIGQLAPETRVFSVDGSKLVQNSIGLGGYCGGYEWLGVVDRRLAYTLLAHARVLEETDTANSFGFYLGVSPGTSVEYGIGIGTHKIQESNAATRHRDISTAIDNTEFHQYRIDGGPDLMQRVLVDGEVIALATPVPGLSGNRVVFGDGTCGTDAHAEMTRFEFAQPRVVSQNPVAGSRVQNRSAVDLTIAEGPGLGQPVAVGDNYQTDEDATLDVPAPGVLANDRDPDGGTLTAVLAIGPSSGSLILRPDGSFTYASARDFSGTDTFRYKANDGSRDSNTVTVRITVREVNDPPIAHPDAKSTDQDRAISFPATDLVTNDSAGAANESTQTLTVTGVTKLAGTQGEVALASGTVTYTRKPGFFGADSFTYAVCDDGATAGAPDPKCATGTVNVDVRRVNRAPVAVDLNVTADEDTPKDVALSATDPDGDVLTFTIVTNPAHGSLSGSGANRTYIPSADYNGTDSFTFKANDGQADSNVATVRVTVREVNDPPVASPDTKSTSQDQALSFPATDLVANDSAGPANESTQTLTVTAVSKLAASQGDVTLAAGTVTYTPKAGFSGSDPFSYTVCDNGTTAGAPAPACTDGTVTVTIRALNRAPVATDVTVVADEDTAKPLTLAATDADGDALTFSVVANPAHGTLTGSGASLTYTPAPDYNGPDAFTFKANDGALDSNVATVRVTVREANDVPVAVADAKSTDQDRALSFPAVDLVVNDSRGPANESTQTLAVTAVAKVQATQGEVALASGNVTYTPKAGFTGSDTFTYTVCDNGTTAGAPDPRCADGTVTVDVRRVGGPALVSIDVAPKGVSLNPGQTRQFTAAAAFADNTSADVTARVTWSSSDAAVATMGPTGVATAVAAGTTSVRATLDGVTGATALSVGSPVVTSIVVEPAAALIVVGQTQAFTARGIHPDGTSELLAAPGLTWSTSSPAVATVAASGVATGQGAGSATITATFAAKTATAALTIRAAAPNGSPPTVAITSPTDGATVTSPVEIRGTATDPEFLRYVLEIAPVGETTFTTIAESTTPVTAGALGTLDPTLLINDLYTLRLTAYDRGANSTSTEVVVQVDREQKVGNFSVSFDDLTVPLSGIDVTVTRTYDSRDKAQGDFGIGWRLGVRDVRLRKTGGVLGFDWVGAHEGSGFNSIYCVSPGRNRTVALTMPGGEVMHFDASVQVADGTPVAGRPNCTRLAPPSQVRIVWTAASHTFGSLAIADVSSTVYIDGNFPGSVDFFLDADLTQSYDPHRFLATLRDGTAFTVTDRSDVQRISDPNGNAITITPNGITHSAGPGVVFERDVQGRITAIVDPAGRRLTYVYDANGDLASRADRNGDITRFSYDRRHNLLQIVDPLGRIGVRNTYDDAGRLVKVTDADGHEVNLAHDLGADSEQVRDRRGNLSVFTYDGNGNVTSETNAESETTLHTYDGNGDELTTVDPLGRTTTRTFDGNRNLLTEQTPLGNVTRFAYGAFDQVTKTVDPTGRTTVNVYDAVTGNLLSTTVALTEAAAADPGVPDACRASTRFTYDSAGNVLTQIAADGAVTTNTYDGAGRLASTKDPTGALTSYTYDANGNRLSQTDALSRVTNFEYDAENRLVRTTRSDGSFTSTTYDGAGRAVATVDELGRVIRSFYDDQGRQIRTGYPDGTSTATEYDANGNATVPVDQLGRRTTTTYDLANRPVRVTHPDGTFTTTVYDDAGQVVEERDERGNPTVTHYDGDGRVDVVTRPLGSVISSIYDAAGRKLADTDANGNTTLFAYDCAGRLTTTTYPATDTQPSTTRVVGYDLVGRRVAETDQAGKTTRFAYDLVGRLTKVTDALGQETRYAYDAVGNRKTQTDANGHTTRMDYDDRNREHVRTLPLGQSTTTDHDVAGNVSSRLDANGRRTTFGYDAMNRLTEKVPDPFFSQPTVRFAFTATGQRKTMVDATGTTTYSYDDRDRLVEKAGPEGTLTYDHEPTGDLKSMTSGHTGGAAMVYEHDALNRITSAADVAGPPGATAYSYDAAGNLTGVALPNHVVNAYTYDPLNRLKKLEATGPSGPLASYQYSVGLAGNRTGVVELSGRTVAYGYDDLYRLTREAVSADPGAINGVVDYRYDPVGNRLQRTSSLAGVPSTTATYDADDRMSGESYDANGNTLTNPDHTFTYDYEDRLTTADGGTVRIVYDGDGNKVAEIASGHTTTFLVDDRNPTGYSQVIDELTDGVLTKTYAYGLDLISQREMPSGTTSWYGYDGHGSVRYLSLMSGSMSDSYTYDAYGMRTTTVGSTPNRFNYGGENSVIGNGLVYLRARVLSSTSGRFLQVDPHRGQTADPSSLHGYRYTRQPITESDPTGLFSLADVSAATAIRGIVTRIFLDVVKDFFFDRAIGWTRRYADRNGNTQLAALVTAVDVAKKVWEIVNFASALVDVYHLYKLKDMADGLKAASRYVARDGEGLSNVSLLRISSSTKQLYADTVNLEYTADALREVSGSGVDNAFAVGEMHRLARELFLLVEAHPPGEVMSKFAIGLINYVKLWVGDA